MQFLRFQAAGDQHVGRTVCGLPVDSPLFAILPPFFIEPEDNNVIVLNAIRACFPTLPPHMMRLAEFCLASLVHHRAFLHEILPNNHKLWETPLFTQHHMMQQLSGIVECRLAKPGDQLRPTGIPPHITLLGNLMEVAKEIKAIIPAMANIAPQVSDIVLRELESRCIELGTVTRDGLEELLTDCLRNAGVFDLVNRFNAPPTTPPQTGVQEDDRHQQSTYRQFAWEGQFHQVPKDFEFPTGVLRTAWQWWMCGNRAKEYPPLNAIKGRDMDTINKRKRLSDMRFVMAELENNVPREIWQQNPTINEANAMFERAVPGLCVCQQSPRDRKRHLGQASWKSWVNMIRKEKKRRRLQQE